jgi:hypothetical protein
MKSPLRLNCNINNESPIINRSSSKEVVNFKTIINNDNVETNTNTESILQLAKFSSNKSKVFSKFSMPRKRNLKKQIEYEEYDSENDQNNKQNDKENNINETKQIIKDLDQLFDEKEAPSETTTDEIVQVETPEIIITKTVSKSPPKQRPQQQPFLKNNKSKTIADPTTSSQHRPITDFFSKFELKKKQVLVKGVSS